MPSPIDATGSPQDSGNKARRLASIVDQKPHSFNFSRFSLLFTPRGVGGSKSVTAHHFC